MGAWCWHIIILNVLVLYVQVNGQRCCCMLQLRV
jgi:hypothetical protein